MMVCLCHPFSDKRVKKHLEENNGPNSVSKTYSACSDGKKPDCCACLETLKDIIKTHKKAVTA